ncbi:MAG: SCO family protein [Thermoanaerobaculia bacterium]|nr:SCO family protein [Thermoanaerobaculia bacterium]
MTAASDDRRGERRFALVAFAAWLATTVGWWALAFAPLPVADTWLAQARAVCFGTLPNGLPDTWGWGALVVSPLAMLGLLLAIWGRDLAAALGALADRRLGLAVIGLVAAVPLAGGLWVGQRVLEARELDDAFASAEEYGPLPHDYPRGELPAPQLGLVDQHGEIVTLEALGGRPALVTFAFGHCRTICPVVVRTVREAALDCRAGDRPIDDLSIVVVSLDPWRDTPSSLPGLAEAWELSELPDAHVLSGEVERVLEVLEAWNMPIERDPKTGDIRHPGLVAVVAADGSHAYSFNSPPTDWVVEALRRLERG